MSSADRNQRLLVTGASGFLGAHICRQAATGWSVVGIGRRHPVTVAGIDVLQGDLTDDAFIRAVFEAARPTAAIHAAAAASPDFCATHPEESRRINVHAAEKLAARCARLNIPLVFVSTDLVFDGRRAPYAEMDPPAPLCTYGMQKADAERRVHTRHPQAVICRLPLLIGPTAGSGGNFSLAIRDALAAGRPINLLADEYRTPVDGASAAAGILLALTRMHGVVHLGGRTRLSRLEMGRRLAALMGCPSELLRAITLKGLSTPARRPPDVSLNSQRAYGWGYDPEDIRTTLEQMAATCRRNRR